MTKCGKGQTRVKIRETAYVLGLMILNAFLLSSCYEFENFKEKMNLTKEQAEKAKPIIEKYLDEQNKIFDEVKAAQPSRGSSEGAQSTGNSSASGTNQPNRDELRAAMEKKRADAEKKFADNDAAATHELETFLTPEQMEAFKKAAEDYRKEQLREIMQPNHGGHGGGGRHKGGGGGGGGMGFGGNGSMGSGGGMGNY